MYDEIKALIILLHNVEKFVILRDLSFTVGEEFNEEFYVTKKKGVFFSEVVLVKKLRKSFCGLM